MQCIVSGDYRLVSPGMMTAVQHRIQSWPFFLIELDAVENAWRGHLPPYTSKGSVPWLPYPMQQFVPLLMDAVMHCLVPEPVFLDAGCGPGTKVQLAEALFGLKGYGIDISAVLVGAAHDRGIDAEAADCLQFDRYDMADIVLLNRPVSDPQQECEERVRDGMKPGAILIQVNGRADPGRDWGWAGISQEYGEPVCGVWRKPSQ